MCVNHWFGRHFKMTITMALQKSQPQSKAPEKPKCDILKQMRPGAYHQTFGFPNPRRMSSHESRPSAQDQ